MKLLVTLILVASPWAASANHLAPVQFGSRKDVALTRSLSVRGGDLGPISAATLAKTFGVLAVGDALTGAVAPVEVWDKFGITIEPGSKGEHYLGHGLASSASSLAVTSLLALFGKASTEEAIAFGFLARAAFMTEMLLTGKYKELGVPSVPHLTVYLLLLATSFALLSGNSDSMAAAKLLSVLFAGHGALLFVNPRADDNDTDKKMASIDGAYMSVSSLFIALLTFGMSPVESMGFTAIACLPLFLRVVDLITADEIFGMSPSSWAAVFVVFIGVFAYGMLT